MRNSVSAGILLGCIALLTQAPSVAADNKNCGLTRYASLDLVVVGDSYLLVPVEIRHEVERRRSRYLQCAHFTGRPTYRWLLSQQSPGRGIVRRLFWSASSGSGARCGVEIASICCDEGKDALFHTGGRAPVGLRLPQFYQ
jgi:hypothetical protein